MLTARRTLINRQVGPQNAQGLRVTDVRMGRPSQKREHNAFGGVVLFVILPMLNQLSKHEGGL